MSKIKGIYFLVFDHGIKMGYSLDIHSRFQVYRSPWVMPIRECYYLECKYPAIVERKLKDILKTNLVSKGSSEFITDIDTFEVLRLLKKVAYSKHKYMILERSYKDKDVICIDFYTREVIDKCNPSRIR